MAGMLTRLQLTYKIQDAGIARYTAVTYGDTEGFCKIPTADNMYVLGVVDNDERLDIPFHASGNQGGRDIAVKVECIADVKLSGVVAYGDRVIVKAGGAVMKCPTAAGKYNVLGFAEKAGVDGDIIPVRFEKHQFTV
jgi:hypothetical protein